MSKISVELVPRQKEAFLKELNIVKDNFSNIDIINIPDISRYEVSSLEAAELANKLSFDVIPHLKAGQIKKEEPLEFKDFLIQNNIKEVLLVLGDKFGAQEQEDKYCNTLEAIAKFKEEVPQIKVYGAIDQYRSTFEKEYAYIQEKLAVGCDGFFTQPFFDYELLEFYLKKLRGIQVYWGVSPVTSQRSKEYWQKHNNVDFPPDFEATLEWNRRFAKMALELVKSNDSNIYFMPIKADFVQYLSGII